MVFEKYRAKLLNDDEITQHIVGYREAYIAFDEDEEFDEEKYNVSYINNLATTFSAICEFSNSKREVGRSQRKIQTNHRHIYCL